MEIHDLQAKATLDVKWPSPSINIEPQHFTTFPSQPILATLEYDEVSCTPADGASVAQYSLQLLYCGSSIVFCDPRNESHTQVCSVGVIWVKVKRSWEMLEDLFSKGDLQRSYEIYKILENFTRSIFQEISCKILFKILRDVFKVQEIHSVRWLNRSYLSKNGDILGDIRKSLLKMICRDLMRSDKILQNSTGSTFQKIY